MQTVRKYEVRLTSEQRSQLKEMILKGRKTGRWVLRCQALLLSDQNHADGQRPDVYIVESIGIKLRTLVRLRQQFVQQGLEAALQRKVRTTPPVPAKITGRVEAQIITLACTDAPTGHARWTCQLLAESATRLKYIESISDESVRKVLKKTNYVLGGKNGFVSRKRIARVS
jgi:Homeodomain-like domain